MKKLMIMGAGIYQVPLIKVAKEMGIYTIAVSIPGKYPGFAYADEVLHINTVDAEAVLEAAKKEQIDGICTAGTDVAVMTIGRVNDALGLCGISYEAAKIACDKVSMKHDSFSVRVQSRKIMSLLKNNKKVRFSGIFTETSDPMEIAVTFVALLQLWHDRKISVSQNRQFDEIYIMSGKEG